MKGTLQQAKPVKLQCFLLIADTAAMNGEWQTKLEHRDQTLCDFCRGYRVAF